jgi:hypothetical protein
MSAILIAGLLIVAALVVWVALQSLGTQKKSEVIESQMTELRRDLQSMATAQAQAAGQITTLTSSVTQRLDTVARSLTDGVAQSADISAKSQTAMREELKSTQGMMERIYKQLGEFQEVSRGLSNAQQSLEAVLGKSLSNACSKILCRLRSTPHNFVSLAAKRSTPSFSFVIRNCWLSTPNSRSMPSAAFRLTAMKHVALS